MLISSFINEISPSSNEISQISVSGNQIREIITSKLNFVVSSMLTGSYIRSTKISPIDDLDIFFKISAGNTSIEWKNNNECKIFIRDGYYDAHPLKNYTVFDNWKFYISPNKILNEIKRRIEEKYTTTSHIKRNGECITTYLSSYDLTLDTIPYTGVEGEDYYLIPTSGNDLYWKKTNPSLDKSRIDDLNNSYHFNGKIKGVIKIMKYWNLHKNTGVKFRSYVLECLIYDALRSQINYNLSYVDLLKIIVSYIYNKQFSVVIDIPGFDYIYYSLSNDQLNRIKGLLGILWNKLDEGEDNSITYLKL